MREAFGATPLKARGTRLDLWRIDLAMIGNRGRAGKPQARACALRVYETYRPSEAARLGPSRASTASMLTNLVGF